LVPIFHFGLQTPRERVYYDLLGQNQTYSKSIKPFVLKNLHIGLANRFLG